MIDFQAKFNQISFVVDKDDTKKKGFEHACRRLQEIQPDLQLNQVQAPFEMWSFGLHVHSIPLKEPITCDLRKLIPTVIDNDQNRPFWFMFKTPPIFQDSKFSNPILKPSKNTRNVLDSPIVCLKFDYGIRADLTSGALISMNRFCVHKDHARVKRASWSFCFGEDFFEIQTIRSERNYLDSTLNLKLIKYKIPLDIIDRAAIIYPWSDGFCVFINMKGNIHELHRQFTVKPRVSNDKDDDYPFEPFVRQGINEGKAQPSFSTIRLRIQIRSDEEINQISIKQDKISSTMSLDQTNQFLNDTREESLDQIRQVFKQFVDFFARNRIHLCFGPIRSRISSLEQLATLNSREFRTFIQSYSWTMLNNIGFRLQNLILLSKTFIDNLYKYSDHIYPDETEADIDDRFYRLCLYLYRRSGEYFFLDLDQEILVGIEEYRIKYTRFKQRKMLMPHFRDVSTSAAYIPSIVFTPTTIKIRPLKLCKLNRVLREKRFGGFLNFALIELRDEAQRSLFPSVFRALKCQIFRYLTDGFDLTNSRKYKYLHHSQSQVKCKQFWFYYHDKEGGYLSHEDAYTWMGNFDKERVVAKHAARIALCFTSTDPTIQVEKQFSIIEKNEKKSFFPDSGRDGHLCS